jgi:hypothetical protein
MKDGQVIDLPPTSASPFSSPSPYLSSRRPPIQNYAGLVR